MTNTENFQETGNKNLLKIIVNPEKTGNFFDTFVGQKISKTLLIF